MGDLAKNHPERQKREWLHYFLMRYYQEAEPKWERWNDIYDRLQQFGHTTGEISIIQAVRNGMVKPQYYQRHRAHRSIIEIRHLVSASAMEARDPAKTLVQNLLDFMLETRPSDPKDFLLDIGLNGREWGGMMCYLVELYNRICDNTGATANTNVYFPLQATTEEAISDINKVTLFLRD